MNSLLVIGDITEQMQRELEPEFDLHFLSELENSPDWLNQNGEKIRPCSNQWPWTGSNRNIYMPCRI